MSSNPKLKIRQIFKFLNDIKSRIFAHCATWKLQIEILFDSNWFLRKGDFLSAHFHFSIHLIGTVWLLPVKLRNSLRLEHEPWRNTSSLPGVLMNENWTTTTQTISIEMNQQQEFLTLLELPNYITLDIYLKKFWPLMGFEPSTLQ